MKDGKVKITALKDGSVVNANNGGTIGYVRVEQSRWFVNKKGFMKKQNVSSLMYGNYTDLKNENLFNGQELPGKIVIKESLTPFNEENPSKDYKYAGKTNIVCCQDGQPIYRKAFYNMDGSDNDEYVQHTNSQDIKDALFNSSEEEIEAADESFAL